MRNDKILADHMRTSPDRLVYFIGAADGPVKIGMAVDPLARLSGLQSANPRELAILAIAKGGRQAELRYHWRFRAIRIRGEWFERTYEVLAEMQRVLRLDSRLNARFGLSGCISLELAA